jgi:hypothetical protein
VSSPDRAPPSLGDDWNKIWRNLIESHSPESSEELSAAHSPSSSPPSELVDGSMDVERPLPSVPKGPSQVPSPDRAPPSLSDEYDEWPSDGWNRWRDLVEGHFPSGPESLAARPSSSSQPSGSVGVQMDVEQLVPPIHEELLPVSSPDRAPLTLGDVWNNMWGELIKLHFPSNSEKPSAARSSLGSQPRGPVGVPTDVERS